MAVQDLSGYTEVDPNSRITIGGTNKAQAVGLTVGEDAYLYKDFTAGHYDGFSINFETYCASSGTDNGSAVAMGLTNSVDDAFNWTAYVKVNWQFNSPNYRLVLYTTDGGSGVIELSADTLYYCTLSRTAGSDNTTLTVYSNSGRTTQVGTQTLAGVGTGTKFRYLYAISALNASSSNAMNCYWQNYEITSYSSSSPSASVSNSPSSTPSGSLSNSPSQTPSNSPSTTNSPSSTPSNTPSNSPSSTPSSSPSNTPSGSPSNSASATPSASPSSSPSNTPSSSPSTSSDGSGTLTVQPCDIDAYLYEGTPTTNYGNDVELRVGATSGGIYNSLLRYDFSALPTGAIISNATLSLYYYDKGTDAVGRTYWVKELNNTGWTEGGVTWNKSDGSASWGLPGGDVIDTNKASTTVPASFGWMNWDITNIIKHFQADSGEIANLHISDGSIGVFSSIFHSSEYTTDTTLRPKLVIQYTVATASPSSTPSNTPSSTPSNSPSATPSNSPSSTPSSSPSVTPSNTPSDSPSSSPSPSNTPSGSPTNSPSNSPSVTPSNTPSSSPSVTPSSSVSSSPSPSPSWTYPDKHSAEWKNKNKNTTNWTYPIKNGPEW